MCRPSGKTVFDVAIDLTPDSLIRYASIDKLLDFLGNSFKVKLHNNYRK
jgi:hypothetical protein